MSFLFQTITFLFQTMSFHFKIMSFLFKTNPFLFKTILVPFKTIPPSLTTIPVPAVVVFLPSFPSTSWTLSSRWPTKTHQNQPKRTKTRQNKPPSSLNTSAPDGRLRRPSSSPPQNHPFPPKKTFSFFFKTILNKAKHDNHAHPLNQPSTPQPFPKP